jgi:hypothetical protein
MLLLRNGKIQARNREIRNLISSTMVINAAFATSAARGAVRNIERLQQEIL